MYGGLLFRNLHGETERNHGNPLSGQPASVKDLHYSLPEYEAGVNQ